MALNIIHSWQSHRWCGIPQEYLKASLQSSDTRGLNTSITFQDPNNTRAQPSYATHQAWSLTHSSQSLTPFHGHFSTAPSMNPQAAFLGQLSATGLPLDASPFKATAVSNQQTPALDASANNQSSRPSEPGFSSLQQHSSAELLSSKIWHRFVSIHKKLNHRERMVTTAHSYKNMAENGTLQLRGLTVSIGIVSGG